MQLITFKAPTFRSVLIQMRAKIPDVRLIQLELEWAHVVGYLDCTSGSFGQSKRKSGSAKLELTLGNSTKACSLLPQVRPHTVQKKKFFQLKQM